MSDWVLNTPLKAISKSIQTQIRFNEINVTKEK